MKAAKRIRAYLDHLQQEKIESGHIAGFMNGPQITRDDLEQILASRESWRQAARTQTEEMLRDLHLALWPDKPVHLHSFEHMLTTIRNRRWLRVEETDPPEAVRHVRAYLDSMDSAGVGAQKVAGWEETAITRTDLEQILASRASWKVEAVQNRDHAAECSRLASQLAAAENEASDLKAQLRNVLSSPSLELADTQSRLRSLRQALREVCEAVLPLYADKDAGQQLAALQAQLEQRAEVQTQLERAENVVRAQKNVIAEIQNAAEQASRSHLPYGRQWTSVPEQIKALGDALSRARTDVDEARAGIAAKVNQALTGVQSKLRDTLAERDEAQRKLRVLQRRLRDLLPEESPGDFIDWSNE